ncbi:MAG: hypothetical protein ACLFS1_09745 [Opitutales bacterium]
MFRLKSKNHLIGLLGLVSVAASANGAVILSDNFNTGTGGYAIGDVDGVSGIADTGSYDTNWEGSTGDGSATFNGDGKLEISRSSGSSDDGYFGAIDPGGAASGDVIYFSASITVSSGVEGAAFGLDFSTSSFNRFSAIGFNAAGNVAIFNDSDDLVSSNSGQIFDGLQSTTSEGADTFSFGTTYLLVGKIEDKDNWSGSDDRVTAWIDPTLGSAEEVNTSATSATVSFNGLNPAEPDIQGFRFAAATDDAGESATLDNLVIGDSWSDVVPVPEPSSFAVIAGLFALGGLTLRRRL